jgi:hypothetical protein
MTWLWNLNLINLFNFYLWLFFLISTYRRIGQYRSVVALVRAVPGRWPHLFELVKGHGHVFLTWTTVLPGLVALLLIVAQTLASWLVWPEAGQSASGLTIGRLAEHWRAVAVVLVLAAAMVGVDLYATFTVGEFDRKLMQTYFDQAEYWLRSWTAPMIRVFTIGFIHPRRMVAVEVRKALIEASHLINSTLWWVSLQTGLRVGFGLALWVSYAWSRQ